MPDSEQPQTHAAAEEAAREALDRAHRAALTADGPTLRLALEEARDVLRDSGARPDIGNLVVDALTELEAGALSAMEPRIEQARSALTPPI